MQVQIVLIMLLTNHSHTMVSVPIDRTLVYIAHQATCALPVQNGLVNTHVMLVPTVILLVSHYNPSVKHALKVTTAKLEQIR